MTNIEDIRSRTQRTNGTRALSSVTTIVRHHSATTSGNFDSFWRHWNGTNGWGTGGYHEIILRDGTVQLCYDPNEITNGVGGANNYTYHICLVGNGAFTAAQEKAWDERVAFNMSRLNISAANVKGHREMPGANTACPGIDMNAVRARITGGAKPATPAKPTAPATSKSIAQMADEVIANKHDNGHDNRRKSLGISAAEYEKVRAEVNRRAKSPKPAPKPKPQTKEYVNLPASAQTWRTYKTNVAPVAKNSDWSLTPAKFGGLTYEVLARPQTDVVTINTSRGRRNIYVARSTGATFTRK